MKTGKRTAGKAIAGATCPVCGSADAFVVSRLCPTSIMAAYNRYFNRRIFQAVSELGLPDRRVQVLRCSSCDLEYTDGMPEIGAEFYAKMPVDDYYDEEKWEHRESLKWLTSRSTILDVGCGNGCFLVACRDAGLVCMGLELNPNAVRKARNMGLEVANTGLDRFCQEHRGKFDAVCAFHVLEHVHNPVEFVAGLRLCCSPNGLILIAVPNQASSAYNVDPYSAPLNAPPHHLTRWRERTLRELGRILDLNLQGIVYGTSLKNFSWDFYVYLKNSRLSRVFSDKCLNRMAAILINRKTYFFWRKINFYGLRGLKNHSILAIFKL